MAKCESQNIYPICNTPTPPMVYEFVNELPFPSSSLKPQLGMYSKWQGTNKSKNVAIAI